MLAHAFVPCIFAPSRTKRTHSHTLSARMADYVYLKRMRSLPSREMFMNIEQPDEMDQRVMLQSILKPLMLERVTEEVSKKYNFLSVEQQKALANSAAVDPMAMMAGDPALAAQMGAFANGTPPPGEEMAMMAEQSTMPNPAGTQGMNGGLPLGVGQPEQTQGRIDQIMADGGLL